jgi:hypothetical protein
MARRKDRKDRLTTVQVEKKLPARKLSVSITGDSGEKLDTFCEAEDRSPSWTVDKLIQKFISQLRHPSP